MTYACMECGEGLPQYKAGYCARCIADEEAHEYEAEDADEGREECELEPDRMTHEGREYYRLADGVELSETDRHTFNRALFGPINWPRRQGQVNSGNMALGNEYWRPDRTTVYLPEAVEADLDPPYENVQIPKDLAKLVLAELSPQWHTKAVRELLRTIEEQL